MKKFKVSQGNLYGYITVSNLSYGYYSAEWDGIKVSSSNSQAFDDLDSEDEKKRSSSERYFNEELKLEKVSEITDLLDKHDFNDEVKSKSIYKDILSGFADEILKDLHNNCDFEDEEINAVEIELNNVL